MKKKITDYLTVKEVLQILGLRPSSQTLITRWIRDGRIEQVLTFGTIYAIPVTWVKSECISRGIDYKGIHLDSDQVGVSLKDYIPLKEYTEKNKLDYGKLYGKLKRKTVNLNYVKFGNVYGIKK